MSIKDYRRKIDSIDDSIISLLRERVAVVKKIGQIKSSSRLSFYDPSREREVLRKVLRKNKGMFPEESLASIYQEIMAACLAVERAARICFLGPEYSFSHSAVVKAFGLAHEYVPVKSITDVFVEVEQGRADYGVVPIENSTEGIVTHTLDMFIDKDMNICSEIYLKVVNNFMSRYPLAEIRKVYSHPQAFAQCRVWIENNLPDVKLLEVSSTSEAARIAGVEKYSGAIGNELAAKAYGLNILYRGIQDSDDNITRFLVLGQSSPKKTGKDKTSVVFSVKDQAGALYEMLKPFARMHVNLTKIESRPSKKKAWQYIFYVDIDGHTESKNIWQALEALKKSCKFFKLLGSYPMGLEF